MNMRTTTSIRRRFRALALLGAPIFLGALVAGCQASGDARADQRMTRGDVEAPAARRAAAEIERYLRIRSPSAPTLAADGTLYATDYPEGVVQLYRRDPNRRPGSPMEALTDFEDGVSGYTLSPDDSAIVVSAAIGGSEQNDLFMLDPDTGEIETLLSDPNIVYGFQEWLPDSSGFLYTANDVDPRFFYTYHFDLRSGESRRLLARDEPGYWFVSDISPQGDRALIARYYSVADVQVFELSLSAGDLRELSVGERPNYTVPVGYTPDGRSALLVSDVEDGLRKLWRYDLRTSELDKPVPDLEGYPVEGGAVSDDHRHVAVVQNVDGYSEPHLFALPAFERIDFPQAPRGVIGGGAIRHGKIVWTLSSARSPGLAYAWSVGEESDVRQITRAQTQGVNIDRFPEPQLIRYTSFDGLEIPAFLYLPRGYQEGDRIPFIAWYHGGPESQYRPSFSSTLQYYLSRGFGVIRPNVRGSTGYGREFHQMDNYKNRWDSVRDGVEAVRWLVDNGYTSPGRVAAYGGSYGGFMCCATLIEGGDLYGAGVNIVGIVNFITFLEQTRAYRRELRETEYGPLSDPEFLASVSPINRIDQIRVPMLIAHGLNDPRVPVGEAMQVAEELQKRGYDPELLFFHDEGHGFRKLDNRILYTERTARFLENTIGS